MLSVPLEFPYKKEKVNYFFKKDGDLKELNPSSVKSPGGFENVAPDAKKIVTPIYASKNLFL